MSEQPEKTVDVEKAVPTERTHPTEETETHHVEKVDSPTPFDNELEKQKTLAHVDLENKLAFKGDDSDGRLQWGFRTVLSTKLCILKYRLTYHRLYQLAS